jgi:aldehyde dehydrogenase (NAD+)
MIALNDLAKREISEIFDSQREYFNNHHPISVAERKDKLKRLLNSIYENQEKIKDVVYKDFKKPGPEVELTEIFTVTSEIKHALRKLRKWTKARRAATPLSLIGTSSRIQYEPKGAALIISPWNFPFQLAIGPLVSALAAGNTVIIKPSEFAPNTSHLIAELISETFNANEAAVVEGDAETAKELLKLPFDHIFFTGSSNVGKEVMKQAADTLTSVTLELGGKSPVIVDKSANHDLAAERIVWGKYINAGQTCIAPDYLIVDENIFDVFTKKLKEKIKTVYGSNGSVENNDDYCRIIDDRHFAKAEEFLTEAEEKGFNIIHGGERNQGSRYIEPTVISDVSLASKLMNEEIFSPILPVLKFQTFEDIKNIIAKNPNPLAAYIFSSDKNFIKQFTNSIRSGGKAVNDVIVHFVNPYLPFGGTNHSGYGSSHGFYGFKEFSNEKSILKSSSLTAVRFLRPPYTNIKRKLIKLIVKYL